MKDIVKGQLLRIFIDENVSLHGKLLYEDIVLKCQELGLEGATVLRGIMGYGAHGSIHTSKILRLSEDMPVVIEIVDSEDKINSILPYIGTVVSEGLVTIEDIRVIKYVAK